MASAVADDEKDFQNGDYKSGHTLPAVNPTPTVAGSEGRAPAKFVTGQSSLIDSEPGVKGRFFDGGYVLVPYKPGLFSEQFTLEAWVRVDLLAANFEHTLFDAGGNYGSPVGTPDAPRGFRISPIGPDTGRSAWAPARAAPSPTCSRRRPSSPSWFGRTSRSPSPPPPAPQRR